MNIGPVTISSFGSSIAGENSSLVCSATIATQIDTPTPTFQWFYGPNNNSLPYGVTASATNNGSTYITTLYFAPLNESHAGMYTCRLGGNTRLAAHTRVIVQGISSTCDAFLHYHSLKLISLYSSFIVCCCYRLPQCTSIVGTNWQHSSLHRYWR